MDIDIDALSTSMVGSKEEAAFIQFVKNHNLNWKLGQPFKIPKVFRSTYLTFVGKDINPDSPYIYLQKCLLRENIRDRRYNESEARITVPYTEILNYGVFDRKRKKHDK